MGRHFIIAALAALSLSACEGNMRDYDYAANHPVKVEVRTALLILEPGAGGHVQQMDAAAIDEFARDYGKKGAGGITVQVGAASTSDPLAASFARDVSQVLVSRGIPANAIQMNYNLSPEAAKHGRAVMQFPIYVAIADECGTWKDRPEFTPLNENTYNYGCATQRNIAAMVVNPRDLVDAEASTGRLAARGDNVVGKYIVGGKIGASQDTQAIVPMTTTGGL
jgi:pilus assembly protein CpaD